MRSCPACGFAASPDVAPGSVGYHQAHKARHLEVFPGSSAETVRSLDHLITLAKRGAFATPTPGGA